MRAAIAASFCFGPRALSGTIVLVTLSLFLTILPTVFAGQLRVLRFSFANGSLLPTVSVNAPPMCPDNHTMCSFEEVLEHPTTVNDLNKKKALTTRSTIMKLLDILEGAAQATGLVKGSLFYSGNSEGTPEVTAKPGLLTRRKRQDNNGSIHVTTPFMNLCREQVVTNEYPDIGRNEHGRWRYLSGRQVVQYTYCMDEGRPCSVDIMDDSPGELTRCVQKFGFSPMVVFDQQTQKFASERILVPCGCQCQYGRG
ncbi:uncharacterized protein LOC111243023 isoform X2 [Varroa destructor]|uniref:Spaetzle domain-containing protein n=1 Tax=Varroa destructor TaxID=109461 RepID=A0A7M7IX71_VARDE|nr:uncharacterized protein LOC111243023 isoform X2 [Varroa destructor]